MGIVFAARSDNGDFKARYNPKGTLTPGIALQSSASAAPLYDSDTDAIGGMCWNLDRSANVARRLVYPVRGLTTARTISVLMRVKLSSAGLFGLFEKSGGGSYHTNRLSLFMATNDWRVTATNANAQTSPFNNQTIQTSAPTTGQYLDIVWTWDGTNGTNAFKLWVDGSNVASLTAGGSLASTLDASLTDFISLGGVTGVDGTLWKFNECVVWDEVINPASVALVGGTGQLDGSTRTAFVDVASLDGSLYTDPGEANVKTGQGYTFAGASKTGTYDGSDRWSDPGVANVRAGTAYKANSSSNNRTGTAAIPEASNVRSGTAVDDTTGTLVVPEASDVRSGVSVDNTTGTLDLPEASDVRDGVAFDDTEGTLVVPEASDVRSGVPVDDTTGTLTVPSLANTKIGVAGDGGVGTYDGSDRWSVPQASEIKHGVLAKSNSLTNNVSGTYRGDDLWQAVSAGDLREGVQKLQDGATVTGTYAVGSLDTRARIDLILTLIDESSLTDNEWEATAIDDDSTDDEIYEALNSVLVDRGSPAGSILRLQYYFASVGVAGLPTDNGGAPPKSNILIGGAL